MKVRINIFFFVLSALQLHAQPENQQTDFLKFFNKDSTTAIEDLIRRGNEMNLADTAQSIKLLRQAVERAGKQQFKYLEAKAYYSLGELYFRMNLYNKSFGSFLNAKNIYSALGAKTEIAFATVNIAKTQYHRGNYRYAVRHFTEAIQAGDEQGNEVVRSEASEYLGLIYNAFQNVDQSVEFFERSLQAKRVLNDEKGVLRITEILSEIYLDARNYEKSLYHASVCRQKAEEMKLKQDSRLSGITLITSLIRLKRWTEVEKELKLFLSETDHHSNTDIRVKLQTLLGTYYLSSGNVEKSRLHYDSAMLLASAFPELLPQVYKNIAETYYTLHDFRSAYEYSQRYNKQLSQIYAGDKAVDLGNIEGLLNRETSSDQIKYLSNENKLRQLQLLREGELREGLQRENLLMDSILIQEKNLSYALASENDARQKKLEKELALKASLDRENTLKEKELKKAKTIKTGLFGGALLLLLSGLVILLLYRKQRRKNELIQKQSDDMQVLMKEIHHRVKNNLQVISSLLDLQSLTIADNQASEAVKEGRNRVQSMALIHQDLYREGNIKGINTKEYISNLLQSLCDSYNITSDKVKVITQIDDLYLDVDTMIPLGLVLNELVSNSLKYAFNGVRPGELSIMLKEEAEHLFLKVSDNGAGYPEGMDTRDSKSFGMKMIRAFAQKLKAKLDIYNSNGAVVEMQITKFKLA